MQAAQRVVRLGHKLRDDAGQRVRQPLGEIRFAVSGDGADAPAIESLRDVILDELNIKRLTSAPTLSNLVTYNYKPNLKTLGQKYGKLSAPIREFLQKASSDQLAPLRTGGTVPLTIEGQAIELGLDDVLVDAVNSAGWVYGEDRGIQVALSTELTPELVHEGIARDFVRHVQQLRKDADLQIEDRIVIQVANLDTEVSKALQQWREYILTETLANTLDTGSSTKVEAKKVLVGEMEIDVSIAKA